MSNPEDLLYSASHEWAKVNGEEAVLGITHFAQESLGDITYVDMPAEGDELTAGSEFGAVESVKAASDLISPVSGTVVAVNTELENAPEVMNSDPYGARLDRAREAVRPARRPDGRRGLRRTLQERAALVRGAAGPRPAAFFPPARQPSLQGAPLCHSFPIRRTKCRKCSPSWVCATLTTFLRTSRLKCAPNISICPRGRANSPCAATSRTWPPPTSRPPSPSWARASMPIMCPAPWTPFPAAASSIPPTRPIRPNARRAPCRPSSNTRPR